MAAQRGVVEHRPQRLFLQWQGGARLQQRLLLLVGQPQRFLVGPFGGGLHLAKPALDRGVGLLEQGDMVALALFTAQLGQGGGQLSSRSGVQAAERQRGLPVAVQGKPCPRQARVHLQCLQRRGAGAAVHGQHQLAAFQAQAPVR